LDSPEKIRPRRILKSPERRIEESNDDDPFLKKLCRIYNVGSELGWLCRRRVGFASYRRLAIKNASPSMIESVQWGWGWAAPAVAGGVVAGAVIGSALARPYYYGPGPYYYPYYPPPYYAAAPAGYYAPDYYGPHPVKARSPTAAAASGHTIRGQEPISGQTDTVTPAPKLAVHFWRAACGRGGVKTL
jgi:hypothetical protein